MHFLRLKYTCVALIGCLLLAGTSVGAKKYKPQKKYGDLVCTELVKVYDGDTFTCNIANLHPLIGDSIRIRVAGIDTPEMKDKRPHIRQLAKEARNAARKFLQSAQKIELRKVRRGNYFRIVADVYADGKSLADFLIQKKLAKVYRGKKAW